MGLSKVWTGVQPVLGSCGAGEVGGEQLVAHWLTFLQENMLWNMMFGAQCRC